MIVQIWGEWRGGEKKRGRESSSKKQCTYTQHIIPNGYILNLQEIIANSVYPNKKYKRKNLMGKWVTQGKESTIVGMHMHT